MEYYNGKLCISMRELVDGGIMTIPNYKQLAARKKIDIARRGDRGGCALVVVDSFPPATRKISTLVFLTVTPFALPVGFVRTTRSIRLLSFSSTTVRRPALI